MSNSTYQSYLYPELITQVQAFVITQNMRGRSLVCYGLWIYCERKLKIPVIVFRIALKISFSTNDGLQVGKDQKVGIGPVLRSLGKTDSVLLTVVRS